MVNKELMEILDNYKENLSPLEYRSFLHEVLDEVEGRVNTVQEEMDNEY